MARDRKSRPGATPVRLFVAFDLPEEVLAIAEEAAAPWRERHPRGRWAPRANQHVTLKFLGPTWPRLLGWVSETVARVAAEHGPAPSRLIGLGAFPNARRARVLWAGLEDEGERLGRLAASLDEALAEEFAPEGRGFTPHLTLARFQPPVELEGLEEVLVRSEPFQVDRIVLYRSHLRRPAPVYEPLLTAELEGV